MKNYTSSLHVAQILDNQFFYGFAQSCFSDNESNVFFGFTLWQKRGKLDLLVFMKTMSQIYDESYNYVGV